MMRQFRHWVVAKPLVATFTAVVGITVAVVVLTMLLRPDTASVVEGRSHAQNFPYLDANLQPVRDRYIPYCVDGALAASSVNPQVDKDDFVDACMDWLDLNLG